MIKIKAFVSTDSSDNEHLRKEIDFHPPEGDWRLHWENTEVL